MSNLSRIDLPSLKEDLIAAFEFAVGAAKTVEDLILLTYRTESCDHPCGISEPLLWALKKHKITIDDYYSLFVLLEAPE